MSADALKLRIAIAEADGWIAHASRSAIKEPLTGMELVCGCCHAVMRKTDRWGWHNHESCGPMGGDCSGGNWTLFESGWSKDGKFSSQSPDYLNSRDAIVAAIVRRFVAPQDRMRFNRCLERILGLEDSWPEDRKFATATATPAQLCRAYVQAAGLEVG